MERSQGHSQTRISIIFFIPQKKKKEKEIEGEGERGEGWWGCAAKGRRRAWGFGAEELRKETTGGLRARASVFQLNSSLSRKPLYRLADPLSPSQSFLPLSAMQNPSPAPSQITPPSAGPWQFMNYSTERCSCPDSLPCFLPTSWGPRFLYILNMQKTGNF